MHNPINRAKQFVQNNRCKIVGVAGIAAGIAIGKNLPTEKAIAVLDITAGQVKQLLDDPNNLVQFETAREHILLVMDNTQL